VRKWSLRHEGCAKAEERERRDRRREKTQKSGHRQIDEVLDRRAPDEGCPGTARRRRLPASSCTAVRPALDSKSAFSRAWSGTTSTPCRALFSQVGPNRSASAPLTRTSTFLSPCSRKTASSYPRRTHLVAGKRTLCDLTTYLSATEAPRRLFVRISQRALQSLVELAPSVGRRTVRVGFV
jgi:hypothetical protein